MKRKDKILYKNKNTKITIYRNNLKETIKGVLGLIVFLIIIGFIIIYLRK